MPSTGRPNPFASDRPSPPPSKAEAAALAGPVAAMRQALALLEGAGLEAAPTYVPGGVRRRCNQVEHCLAQARSALRRGLELARQE